ncbi:hypothetical protein MYX75_02220 [Acidobacteria bacterium AH-259-A15]|nr:hypothetical protein [Acidobacteria bacterium AH-259-A15]
MEVLLSVCWADCSTFSIFSLHQGRKDVGDVAAGVDAVAGKVPPIPLQKEAQEMGIDEGKFLETTGCYSQIGSKETHE